MNYVFLLSTVLIASMFVMNAYGDIASPLRQMKAGIIAEEILCNDGLTRMVDSTKSKAICVKETTSNIFLERGWQVVPGRQVQATIVENTLSTIATIKTESVGARGSSTAIYDHVFEVCAGPVTFVAPNVIIKSDIETKTVTVSTDVAANSCLVSAATITAVNADSIRSDLISHDSIQLKISSVSDEISNLTQQLEDERRNFAAVIAEPESEAKKQRVDESTNKISQLRQSIAGLKDDLNRYYFVLYDASRLKAVQPPSVSFSGTQISENSIKIISSTPARTQGMFDLVLELCAGEKSISDPMVTLSSDVAERTVKLNRINSDSCYKTGAKIEARSQDSITVRFSQATSTHIFLEETIKEMEERMNQKRVELTQMTQSGMEIDPKQVHRLTEEMSSLRAEILTAKAMLHQSLYKSYKAG
jgi:hypothetical protein